MALEQGWCLLSVSGHATMQAYDELPREVRTRLKSSDFNLCPICCDTLSTIRQAETALRMKCEPTFLSD